MPLLIVLLYLIVVIIIAFVFALFVFQNMNKFPGKILDLARTITSNTKIGRSASLYRGGITYNRDFQKALIHYLFIFWLNFCIQKTWSAQN